MTWWPHIFKALFNDRWLVFVCAMWIQSVAGVGYLFGGSMSPVIKTTLGYSQKQVALLGVAKNLGDAIGFVSGALSEVSPSWMVLLVGAAQNLLGYGVVWLVVTGLLPTLPLWMVSSSLLVFAYIDSHLRFRALARSFLSGYGYGLSSFCYLLEFIMILCFLILNNIKIMFLCLGNQMIYG